ncbi:hypothetical protein [Paraburkholderia azotifigens]|uniref:Uncharacterized protein n=1 Tax=Paraburkholderia azotifigens TaxID=2057004 RepID=A0A5C6VBS9_9BURK|nr:hypothetical protein [Paraburkholderia azotifigens]TXC81035.1 hypothetical protein FRZ40_43345 [Paraburkholderia azotifigens]
MRLKIQQNGNQMQSYIYLSTYTGNDPKFKRFVGSPCLVYNAVSNEWDNDGSRGISPTFTFATADNPEARVLVLETQINNIFHYALMDLSDPELWKTLGIWKQNRGLVVVRGMAGGVSVNACGLDDESATFYEKYRRDGRVPNPDAFYRYAQSLLEHKSFEQLAAHRLEQAGGEEGVTPIVEVQILEGADVRGEGTARGALAGLHRTLRMRQPTILITFRRSHQSE